MGSCAICMENNELNLEKDIEQEDQVVSRNP